MDENGNINAAVDAGGILSVEDIEKEIRGRYGKELLLAREVRDYLRISPSTSSRMRRSGCYPETIEVGLHHRVHVRTLAAWVHERWMAPKAPVTGKKRGRPVGSRNRKKAADALPALSAGGQA